MKVEGNVIEAVDIDLVEGTPVLDIKPFAPKGRHLRGMRYGWLEGKDAERYREG